MLLGSAWAEYKKSKTVHGIPLPDDLVESSRFPEPLFTPSTKADQGEHDENISPDQGKLQHTISVLANCALSINNSDNAR